MSCDWFYGWWWGILTSGEPSYVPPPSHLPREGSWVGGTPGAWRRLRHSRPSRVGRWRMWTLLTRSIWSLLTSSVGSWRERSGWGVHRTASGATATLPLTTPRDEEGLSLAITAHFIRYTGPLGGGRSVPTARRAWRAASSRPTRAPCATWR